jgi:hypothetical protein
MQTLTIDPSTLDPDMREMLAARIDEKGVLYQASRQRAEIVRNKNRIVADSPDLESLLDAIRLDEEKAQAIFLAAAALNGYIPPASED